MVSLGVGVLTKIVVPDMYKALSIHKIRQNTKMPTFYKTLYLVDQIITKGDIVPIGIMGHRLDLMVVRTNPPKGSLKITDSTQIIVSEEIAEGLTTQITYEDVGGLKDEVTKVREMIELPLLDFEALKIK
jgi:transitional endoplasmic reticulum ATPase